MSEAATYQVRLTLCIAKVTNVATTRRCDRRSRCMGCAGGEDARSGAARLGEDAEQPRQRTLDTGRRESGTARLEEAVAAYRAALEERTRDRVPLDWAQTQKTSAPRSGRWASARAGRRAGGGGGGLSRGAGGEDARSGAARLGDDTDEPRHRARMLGERENGTARLEEAVAAYRAALEERTRQRVPLEWAMTQKNLGTALLVLGGRENGTARWRRRWRRIAPRWRRERASGCRSTGR